MHPYEQQHWYYLKVSLLSRQPGAIRIDLPVAHNVAVKVVLCAEHVVVEPAVRAARHSIHRVIPIPRNTICQKWIQMHWWIRLKDSGDI